MCFTDRFRLYRKFVINTRLARGAIIMIARTLEQFSILNSRCSNINKQDYTKTTKKEVMFSHQTQNCAHDGRNIIFYYVVHVSLKLGMPPAVQMACVGDLKLRRVYCTLCCTIHVAYIMVMVCAEHYGANIQVNLMMKCENRRINYDMTAGEHKNPRLRNCMNYVRADSIRENLPDYFAHQRSSKLMCSR